MIPGIRTRLATPDARPHVDLAWPEIPPGTWPGILLSYHAAVPRRDSMDRIPPPESPSCAGRRRAPVHALAVLPLTSCVW